MSAFADQELDLDPVEVARRHSAGELIIVDVREPYEWEAGRVPGSSHVEMERVASMAREIPRDTPSPSSAWAACAPGSSRRGSVRWATTRTTSAAASPRGARWGCRPSPTAPSRPRTDQVQAAGGLRANAKRLA